MSLSAAELNSIISVENDWLTGTAIIYRKGTATPDGIGGYSDSYAAVGTVSCDLWENSGRDYENAVSANQDLSLKEWFITVPYNTDILESDIVTIDSKAFDIMSVPLKQSLNTALRCRALSRNQFTI